MDLFLFGMMAGAALALGWIVFRFFMNGRRAKLAATEDLKRLGYRQVMHPGVKIRMNFGGYTGRFIFIEGAFRLELPLARVPRPDKPGREWKPWFPLDNGGRVPLSTGQLADLVEDTIDNSINKQEGVKGAASV